MEPIAWAVILLFLALVFLVLEVFIPSGGVLGFMSALLAVAALVVAFFAGFHYGVVMLAVMMVVAPTAIYGAVTLWPKTAIGRSILIQLPEHPDEMLPDTEEYREWRRLVGRQGTTKTRMMLSGTIVIDGRTYDAVTDGEPADPGQAVQVIDLQTNQMVVRVLSSPPQVEPGDSVSSPQPPSSSATDPLSRPVKELGLDAFNEPLS